MTHAARSVRGRALRRTGLLVPRAALAGALISLGSLPSPQGAVVVVSDPTGAERRCAVPVSVEVNLGQLAGPSGTAVPLRLVERGSAGKTRELPAQFLPAQPGSARGKLQWLLPPGRGGRQWTVQLGGRPVPAPMQAEKDQRTGRWDIRDAGKLVLGYNYQTNEPGELLAKIQPGNLKYARPRSDYIHPLCGLDGEVLTKDWSVDHPHHRGIYWAWPEVDYRGERGDLHALQRVFARPSGTCAGQSGPVIAQIDAENLWLWEDREPIVRERAVIRAWRADADGRFVDLEFRFTALKENVAVARRETKLYGGLNLRMAAVKDQQIALHTDPPGADPRRAWADLSGTFAGGERAAGLTVLQNPANPDFPGDWVKYPELNWFQPTFPAAGTRYVLKKDQPLVLRYRLWIHRGTAAEPILADLWSAYVNPPNASLVNSK